ncbi:MAG: hypothetical protein M3P41_06915 [Actinomycetota bacterium]|nr:hypothetical protein [Actinomycetota bacterium]
MSTRRWVTVAVVAACASLFGWEWAAAPRVHADARVERQLRTVVGRPYLGSSFEGLLLRTVRPFLYSDCLPGRPHVVPCTWVRVENGSVTGSDSAQVGRAVRDLRPVG